MKNCILVLAFFLLAGGQSFSQIKKFNDSSWYAIIATHSNKALEIKDASLANGVQVQQNDSTGAANQLFRFKKVSISNYEIIAKHSGKALQIRDASINESYLEQNEVSGKENQLFILVKSPNGTWAILVKSSGSGFDVLGGVNAMGNGIPVCQYPSSGAANQYFRIQEVAK